MRQRILGAPAPQQPKREIALAEFALMVQDMRRKQRKLRDGSAVTSRTFRSELLDLERRVDAMAEKILQPSLPMLGGDE